MTDGYFDHHLDESDIAAYADGRISAEARAGLQAHLATCGECRAEMAEISRIVATLPISVRAARRTWIPAAAAAAAVFFLAWPRETNDAESRHRKATVTITVAPIPIAPLATVASAEVLVWSAVPSAYSYRVRLFDRQGTVIWERETADTSATTPDSVRLRAGQSYFWRVEARTGFDRVAESDLTEFVVRRKD